MRETGWGVDVVSSGTRTERVGRHEISFLPPATIVLAWCGDVSPTEAHQVSEFILQHMRGRTRTAYVTDVSRLGQLPAEARRALLSRRDVIDEPRTMRLAFAGANLRTRILMSTVIAAADMTSRDHFTSRFFPTLEEAIDWAREFT